MAPQVGCALQGPSDTITLMDQQPSLGEHPETPGALPPNTVIAPSAAAPTSVQPVTAPAHDQPIQTPEAPTVGTEGSHQQVSRPTPALPANTELQDPGTITWTASEFIAHQKSTAWYVSLSVGAVAGAGLAWFITKDFVPPVVVVIGALLFGFYAGHKPRQMSYSLDDRGLMVGGRFLPFSEFRSFSVVPEGAFASIELAPLKRFATVTTIYFDPADEDKIVSLLAAHLPMEEVQQDSVDQLMRRIRF